MYMQKIQRGAKREYDVPTTVTVKEKPRHSKSKFGPKKCYFITLSQHASLLKPDIVGIITIIMFTLRQCSVHRRRFDLNRISFRKAVI